MNEEITTGNLARLFDVTAKTIAELAKRNIITKGSKRGTWDTWDSVNGYVKHLREEAAGRGGDTGADVRARNSAVGRELEGRSDACQRQNAICAIFPLET
jgi:phage terminase Nu1 subunit (DNA packaging protein)